MKRILFVFGTRPEAIKLAPLIQQLKKKTSYFAIKVCVTAQHREMLDQVLRIFDIAVDHDLNIMKQKQDLFGITKNCLIGIKSVLRKEKPDLVIVQGDTTTAFAAALAAFYSKTAVAHVEAGLRTNNKYSPFPEEVSRHLISVLADYHFAPTRTSKSNLLKEGVSEKNIWVTGNTVVDAFLGMRDKQKKMGPGIKWPAYFKKNWKLDIPAQVKGNRIILVTGHRRESFGVGIRNICLALKEIAVKRRDVTIVYAVHLNPNVLVPVKNILGNIKNISLIDPLEYEPFVFLMCNSCLILTDSGGMQEEAASLQKPVLVMRKVTERPEGVKAGIVKLVGTDKELIVKEALRCLDNKALNKKRENHVNPYGDGRAAQRIINVLCRIL